MISFTAHLGNAGSCNLNVEGIGAKPLRSAPSTELLAGMLVAANKKEILARVLRNLKAIYLEREDDDTALSVMEWIIALSPVDPLEVRDRGLLFARLQCSRAAAEDLERYLELAPEAEDAREIRLRVVELRQAASRLN